MQRQAVGSPGGCPVVQEERSLVYYPANLRWNFATIENDKWEVRTTGLGQGWEEQSYELAVEKRPLW